MDAQAVVGIAIGIFGLLVSLGIVMAIFDIAKQTKLTAKTAEKISEQLARIEAELASRRGES